MKLSKMVLASSVALAFSVNLFAQESYTIKDKTLKEALEIISKKSNLSYIANDKLLESKDRYNIEDVEGLEKALGKLLQNTGLKAIIRNDAIVIVEEETKKEDEPAALEPMTVTATTSPIHYLKSEDKAGALGTKSILDTPFSITQVDSNEISQRGAKTIGQIFTNDPSVHSPFASSTTTWWGNSIRGLAANNFYIDGVPISLTWGGDFPTEVVDKVSLLKGLGGFMYGFGSPGGILNYKLKRPTEEPETALHLTYSNNSRFKEHIDTSFNIGEDLGIRANIVNEHGTAYNESEADRQTYSLAIDKKFGDNLTWYNNIVYEKNKIEKQPFHFYFWDIDVVGGTLPAPTYDYENINVDNSYYETETRILTTGLDWHIDNQWKLNFLLGYSFKDQKSNRSFVDITNSAGDYKGNIYNFATEEKKTLANIMLEGDISAFDMEHNIVLGASQQNEKARSQKNSYYSNDFNGNLYQEQTFVTTRTPDFSLASTKEKITQTSVFASDTLKLNKNWTTIAGVRFINYENKDLDHSDGDSTYDKSAATPTLALVYKPNPSTSLYSSYVQSLENGGRVSSRYANSGEVLDPTISKQYELGAKFAYDKVGGAVALFRIEKVNTKTANINNQSYLTQDGLAVYDGLELSGSYQLNNELRLGSGVTYLDAKIKKASDSATEGNRPSGAAKLQSVITTEYIPNQIEGISLHGNIKYSGKRYYSDSNHLEFPSFTTVNGGLAYDFVAMDTDMTFTGNVNNILNKKYWAGGIESGLGEARNFTLSLSAYF